MHAHDDDDVIQALTAIERSVPPRLARRLLLAAACELRVSLRDHYARRAARAIDDRGLLSSQAAARAVREAFARYLESEWPQHQHLPVPPPDLSDLDRSLFWIMKLSSGLPSVQALRRGALRGW